MSLIVSSSTKEKFFESSMIRNDASTKDIANKPLLSRLSSDSCFSESLRLAKKAYLDGRLKPSVLYAECCLKIAMSAIANAKISSLTPGEIVKPLALLFRIYLIQQAFHLAAKVLHEVSSFLYNECDRLNIEHLVLKIGAMYVRLEEAEKSYLLE